MAPEPQPAGWLSAGQLVVFVSPDTEALHGAWSVREIVLPSEVRLQKGNTHTTAQPSELAHVYQAGPDVGAEEMARHRVVAIGGKLVKNAYGCVDAIPDHDHTTIALEAQTDELARLRADNERLRTSNAALHDALDAALDAAQSAVYDAMHAGDLSRAYHDSVIGKIEEARGAGAKPGTADPMTALAALRGFRRRIIALSTAAGLPREVWSELCRLDSEMSQVVAACAKEPDRG